MNENIKFINFPRSETASILGNRRIAETYQDWRVGKYRWYVKDSEGSLHEGSEKLPETASSEALRVLQELYPGHEIQFSVWT